jgi:predicted PurR-regulated permease PerM
LLFNPVYSWLGRHGFPKPRAPKVMLVGLTIIFSGLFMILGTSITRFSSNVGSYTHFTANPDVRIHTYQFVGPAYYVVGVEFLKRHL